MRMFGLNIADTKRVLIASIVLAPFSLAGGMGVGAWTNTWALNPFQQFRYPQSVSAPPSSTTVQTIQTTPPVPTPKSQSHSQVQSPRVTSTRSVSTPQMVTTTPPGRSVLPTTQISRSAEPSTSTTTSRPQNPLPSTRGTQPTTVSTTASSASPVKPVN